MAAPARTDARRRAALALLVAAALAGAALAPPAARAAAEPLGPPAPAPADSAELVAQATGSGTAGVRAGAPAAAPDVAQAPEPGAGFTLRRVANPRYRSFAPPAGLLAPPTGQLVGSEYARAQVTHRESGSGFNSTDWDLTAGRDHGVAGGIELAASGYSNPQYDDLRTLRLAVRQGPIEWSLGDVVPQPFGTLPWIQRLRGGMVGQALSHGAAWRALGGVVPTLAHDVTPNAGLAGVVVDRLPLETGALSLGVLGFGRRAPPVAAASGATDTLAGEGAELLYAARVPSGFGDVGSTFVGQIHDLDGDVALAGMQALEWTLARPTVLATVRDQVATTNARLVGTDRLIVAPRHEGRVNAQVRLASGRAEAHLDGLTSSGTDPGLAAETVQLGASGNLGRSGWYTGLDFSWNRRAPTFDDERRLALQTGRVSERGNVVLLRVERDADNAGRDLIQLTGEGAASPRPGLRLSLEPRVDWQARALDRALLSARLGWPLWGPSFRMSASVTASTARDQGFRGELAEASLGLSFAPRARDRATLEARRYEENGLTSLEYTGGYDLQANLYANPASAPAAARTGVLVVTVTRADSTSGVPDVLVSLDGRDLRFTDADGIARFTDVPPGAHTVSLVETSLPAMYRPVGSASAFVTIERNVAPAPLRFEIARPIRRVRY